MRKLQHIHAFDARVEHEGKQLRIAQRIGTALKQLFPGALIMADVLECRARTGCLVPSDDR